MMTLKHLYEQTAVSDEKFRTYIKQLIDLLGDDTMVSKTAVRGASAFVTAANYAEYIKEQQGGSR